tara:strand:- start:4609 stop:4788 length:180 start_codon:yes stop_codon:yes gene_type:complete
MTYKSGGVKRLIFVNNTKFNDNVYTLGSGVGAQSRFVRSNLYKNAVRPSCCSTKSKSKK